MAYHKKRIESDHLLYVSTGCATEDQLTRSILKGLKDAEKEHNLGLIETNFFINLPKKMGKRLGFGYIWFTNPQIALMLAGKNMDGSSRVETVLKPDWVSDFPKHTEAVKNILDFINSMDSIFSIGRLDFCGDSYEKLLKELSDRIYYLKDKDIDVITDGIGPTIKESEIFNDENITSLIQEILEIKCKIHDEEDWATMDEYEQEDNDMYVRLMEKFSLYMPPIIKNPLPPLIFLPSYRYTKDQINMKLVEAQARGEDIDTSKIPEHGTFEVSLGYAYATDNRYNNHNELFANCVPSWVNLEKLKEVFTPLTSLSTRGKYPKLKWDKSGTAIRVTFSPYTNDGAFALLMLKKVDVIGPNKEEHTICFNHSKKHRPRHTN